MADNLNIISNNVNGLRSTKKRIKMFEYLKSKICNNGMVFLQETHSSENSQSEWHNDFNGEIYFSHGTTNSCGVMIGFITTKKICVNKISQDTKGRILIIDVSIDDMPFILVNLYNANTEAEQLLTLCEFDHLLDDFLLDNSKNIVFAGDLNLFFDPNLEASGGSPTLKKKSVSKLIQLTGKYDLVDIWRIRNPKSNRFTFRQNHFSGFLQRRLDYVFVSNFLQESIQNIDILPSFCTDHSPIFFCYKRSSSFESGKNFWKFNSSLSQDETYLSQMKEHISLIKNESNECFSDSQTKWEYLKYKIRKFTISYSKTKAKKNREKKTFLENRLKSLEKNINSENDKAEYENCRQELNKIYHEISIGIKIRSRCDWYEFGEKSNKYFLNLEKHRASQNTVKKIISDKKEITDIGRINDKILSFYKAFIKLLYS